MIVTLSDAARQLGKPVTTVWYAVRRSTIPRMKIGQAVVVRLEDVERLFASGRRRKKSAA